MARVSRWIGVIFLIASTLPMGARAASAKDYWMYVGNYTTLGGKGIYLFKYHAASGKVEPAGMAAGRIWDSSRDAWTVSFSRIAGQIATEWPNFERIVLGVQNPSFLAIHPNGRFLYCTDNNTVGKVTAFRMDRTTGQLILSDQKLSHGGHPSFLSIDRTGKNLLVANFDGGMSVLRIDAGGRLSDATSVIHPTGTGAAGEGPSHPHSINLSPDNRFAVATDMGLNEVLVYAFDPAKGALAITEPPSVKTPPGSGARHLSFHPNGRFAYVIEEQGSSITTLAWDAGRGVFSPLARVGTLPASFHGENIAADVVVHPSGRFVYGSNRGHDSIAVFAVDPATGVLSPVECVSSLGRWPSGIQIDPTGNYLFAADSVGKSLVQFRIDLQTGRLTPTGDRFAAGNPSCIRFVAAN